MDIPDFFYIAAGRGRIKNIHQKGSFLIQPCASLIYPSWGGPGVLTHRVDSVISAAQVSMIHSKWPGLS